MIVRMLDQAERDLQAAYDHYFAIDSALASDLITQFRRAVEHIVQFPNAWQALDETYRRFRLHRFPYGVVYRTDANNDQILVIAVAHLARRPDWWRDRAP